MGIKHMHIVRELTQSQVHSLDKDYSGHHIEIQNKSQEFGNTNGKAKSHSVDYPIS